MGAIERSRAAKRVRRSEVIHRPLAAVTFNALTLNALAMVGSWQLHQGEGMSWIERLDQVAWSIHNPHWEGVCRFNGRIVKNNITTKALATYIEKHTGKGDRPA